MNHIILPVSELKTALSGLSKITLLALIPLSGWHKVGA